MTFDEALSIIEAAIKMQEVPEEAYGIDFWQALKDAVELAIEHSF